MTILGIDPGTAITGYGVISSGKKSGEFELVDYGAIITEKYLDDAERLVILATDLEALIKKFKPDVAGIEKLFFTSNQKTAMSVSQARGVALYVLQKHAVSTHEFTPLQVKNTVCGYGKADKKQVQFMVQKTFKLAQVPQPDDAADAVAIALCAGLSHRL